MGLSAAFLWVGRHSPCLRSHLVQVPLPNVREHHPGTDGGFGGIYGRFGDRKQSFRAQSGPLPDTGARVWNFRGGNWDVCVFLSPDLCACRSDLCRGWDADLWATGPAARAEDNTGGHRFTWTHDPDGRHLAPAGGVAAEESQ